MGRQDSLEKDIMLGMIGDERHRGDKRKGGLPQQRKIQI